MASLGSPPQQAPRLVLLGPPGAGKSSVAEQLARRFALTIIATGRRLRQEAQSSSAIGRRIAPLLEQGRLIPDELMQQLLSRWLAEIPPQQGFVLDGYPRSIEQAQQLQTILADFGWSLDLVVDLALPPEEARRRLAGRRLCQWEGEPFVLHIDDAEAVQRCREQGGQLVQRADDQPEVVAQRLRRYAEKSQPVRAFYAQRNVLRQVDARRSLAEVSAELAHYLELI
jgi:adenylate kinase